MKVSRTESEAQYRIGTVCRLTGIAPATLRAWERRYRIVQPGRNPNNSRLYRRADITRLTLIKQLVDLGDAISTVANLSLDSLRKRLGNEVFTTSKNTVAPAQIRPRIAVLGTDIVALIEREDNPGAELDVAGMYRDRKSFEKNAGREKPQLIVLEYATVQSNDANEIRTLLLQSGAAEAIVIYRFGARSALRELEKSKFILIRAPITFTELRQLCIASVSQKARGVPELSSAVPTRRFTDKALSVIANASQSLACECPVHLVDLIRGLTAFETYSKECIVANPTDVTVHTYLHAASAQARSIIEQALTHVAEADGLHPAASVSERGPS